jgi:hypothetical protein
MTEALAHADDAARFMHLASEVVAAFARNNSLPDAWLTLDGQ